jgi:isoleucyl-tRNA synthetase
MADYKSSLNLPRTSFPMRAQLQKKEPQMIEFWERIDAYGHMIEANADRERFVLHDGPPYANGNIHLGTAMNKILKDIIVKSQNLLAEKRAEYVPGWDCHGLPIELKVEHELSGKKSELSLLEIRQRCRDYARKYLDIQRDEFKRLGAFGVWEKPYLTMDPAYEAATARELCRFMERGSVLRHKKPIYWCPSCQTALAEAEVEYFEQTSPSIYVEFPLTDARLAERLPQADGAPVSVLIWTTTPWTIPSNLAVALHPELEYALVKSQGRFFILAKKLVDDVGAKAGWDAPEIVATMAGSDLEGLVAEHPIYGRQSLLVLADYVTLETGTGCVHTAPGHGQEDYETGLGYGLDIYAPVDDQGRFQAEVDHFAGLHVFEANPRIIDRLRDMGRLLAEERISHTYPHCWRCKKPVIYRATTQWFISMAENGLRDKALQAIDGQVTWIPRWGRQRIRNMIAHRPDWCISRQRSWGVPIVALICQDCGQAFFDPEWAHAVVDRFAAHDRGADYWFEAPIEEIAPDGLTCNQCGGGSWRKESDILDVWFDSGTSYAAVLEQRQECTYPADMYLEGSDQHRGWFHSSLLASVGTRDRAPYRSVLTHGFVVDGEGKKMSKSLGNVIAPQEIIKEYGSEILRMWVASENYQEDLRISKDILKQLVDNYRRIRNTCRYILGNLSDFDPQEHALGVSDMLPMDRFAVDLIRERHARITSAYSSFELHKVFHTLHTMCVNDLSAFYLDILKDRLYVNAPDDRERRSAQNALVMILLMLVQDMAPILSFTAEEVFQHMSEGLRGQAQTVFELKRTDPGQELLSPEERQLWDLALAVRQEVTKAIEPQRKEGHIGHSLDTRILLYADEDLHERLLNVGDRLRELFIVSQAELHPMSDAPSDCFASQELPGLKVQVSRASGAKCQRCWCFSQEIGSDDKNPEVCPRCASVLQTIGEP